MSKLLLEYGKAKCACCRQEGTLKCSGCSGDSNCLEPAYYCSKECQKKNWSRHKKKCPAKQGPCPVPASWVDFYRCAECGPTQSRHSGELELVTWDFETQGWCVDMLIMKVLIMSVNLMMGY